LKRSPPFFLRRNAFGLGRRLLVPPPPLSDALSFDNSYGKKFDNWMSPFAPLFDSPLRVKASVISMTGLIPLLGPVLGPPLPVPSGPHQKNLTASSVHYRRVPIVTS